MDRFSEQLITKHNSTKDTVLRILIIVGALIVLAALVLAYMIFGPSLVLPILALAVGDLLLAKWLIDGTFTEYEYIVTNDDLDIDKITGRRNRKRMITIKLSKVTEMEKYDPSAVISSDITVIAHDETGENMWYVLADTDKYGKLAIIFNPNGKTVINMMEGFTPSVKFKYASVLKKYKEAREESDNENDSE